MDNSYKVALYSGLSKSAVAGYNKQINPLNR